MITVHFKGFLDLHNFRYAIRDLFALLAESGADKMVNPTLCDQQGEKIINCKGKLDLNQTLDDLSRGFKDGEGYVLHFKAWGASGGLMALVVQEGGLRVQDIIIDLKHPDRSHWQINGLTGESEGEYTGQFDDCLPVPKRMMAFWSLDEFRRMEKLPEAKPWMVALLCFVAFLAVMTAIVIYMADFL